MILSDSSIIDRFDELFPQDGLHQGNCSINKDLQVQPASIDIRLGTRFWKYKLGMPSERRIIDPLKDDAHEFMTMHECKPGEAYILYPGPEYFCLAETMESVVMPNDLVAEVDGRSSFGRWGLSIHCTAGLVDPGFRGSITLEMSVGGRFPVKLTPGTRIGQLVFHDLSSPAARPYGHISRRSKYQDSLGAMPSRSNQDGEQT